MVPTKPQQIRLLDIQMRLYLWHLIKRKGEMFPQDAFWLYTLDVLELEFKSSLQRHFKYPNLKILLL